MFDGLGIYPGKRIFLLIKIKKFALIVIPTNIIIQNI